MDAQAVIMVPTSFHDTRRQVLKDADMLLSRFRETITSIRVQQTEIDLFPIFLLHASLRKDKMRDERLFYLVCFTLL